jgi:hypothetical protein
MKAAIPRAVVYMEKDEGKKETEAWNIPGLVSMMRKKSIPSLGLRVLEMVE